MTITRVRGRRNTRTAIGTALLPRWLREMENGYRNGRTMTERATAVASIAAEWCRIIYHCDRSSRHFRCRLRPPHPPPITNACRRTTFLRHPTADPYQEVRHPYRQPSPTDPLRRVGHRPTPNKCCSDRYHLRCCCCHLSSFSSSVPTGYSPIAAEDLDPWVSLVP